jgi:tetratricopeptide (TPR) repeat protein
MKIAAEAIDWKKKWHPHGGGGKGPVKRGLGMALHTWGGGAGPCSCTVKIHPDGSVETFLGSQDDILDLDGTDAQIEGNVFIGRIDEAAECAKRALDRTRLQRQRGTTAYLLCILGQTTCGQEPPDLDAGGRYFDEAMALADELGMRPLAARCHLGLGKLYRRAGKRQQTLEHFTTATIMYREMDMRFWLEQADAELRELA